MFDYFTGARLLDFYQPASVTFDLHLQCIAEYLGLFPPSLRAVVTVKNISMSKVYIFIYTLCASHKPTDELLRIKEPSPHTLEDRIADYKHLNKADIASAAVFIRRCLTIDASVRPSALELLDDDECLHGV
jgi:serine/threonine-protein kinase SRPK3